jgi:hypothetical protein
MFEKIPDQLRTREQVAGLLGISLRTLARLEKRGLFFKIAAAFRSASTSDLSRFDRGSATQRTSGVQGSSESSEGSASEFAT